MTARYDASASAFMQVAAAVKLLTNLAKNRPQIHLLRVRGLGGPHLDHVKPPGVSLCPRGTNRE